MSDWISDGCSSGLLESVPSFDIAQTVYEALPLEAALEDYDALTALGYSVSIFTTWRDAYVADQLWVKRRVDAPGAVPDTVLGARRATVKRHPLPGVDPEHCTEIGRASSRERVCQYV